MNDDFAAERRRLKSILKLGFISDGIELSDAELDEAVNKVDFEKSKNMPAVYDRAVARAATENRDIIEVLKEEMASARRAGELQ
jgi:hypothetical protein